MKKANIKKCSPKTWWAEVTKESDAQMEGNIKMYLKEVGVGCECVAFIKLAQNTVQYLHCFRTRQWTFELHKRPPISWSAGELLACQGLCSMNLDSYLKENKINYSSVFKPKNMLQFFLWGLNGDKGSVDMAYKEIVTKKRKV
jgi:hypothetical protein